MRAGHPEAMHLHAAGEPDPHPNGLRVSGGFFIVLRIGPKAFVH